MPLRIEIPRHSGETRLIATFTEGDTNKHLLDLTMINNADKLRAIIVGCHRSAGAGNVILYPMEGSAGVELTGKTSAGQLKPELVFIKYGRLQYSASAVGATHDIYLLGCLWKEA